MGSIILCHKKKAKYPYEISRIQRKIYTIEELCYYLCNHLYLVDYTIMNESLCSWLEEELELKVLSDQLREIIKTYGSSEQFVLTIFSNASIYTAAELREIEMVLEKLKNQKPLEKQKYKADNLLASGAIRSAISIYQSILDAEVDESIKGKFYGKVYACLGAAYGRLFLYEQASKMYEAAFQICEEKSMLKAYVYACLQWKTAEEFQELLNRSYIYQKVYTEIQEEMQEVEEKLKFSVEEDNVEQWKESYRRIGMGEV